MKATLFRGRRITALILAFTLLFSSAALAAEHATTDFADMKYARPDTTGFDKLLDDTAKLTGDAANADEVLKNYAALLSQYETMDTMYNLAYIKFSQDQTNAFYTEENEACYAILLAASSRLIELGQTILASPCADAAKEAWGEERVQFFADNAPLTEEQMALLNEEQKLISSYGAEAVNNDADSSSRFQTLGNIYVQLIAKRAEIAKAFGYANYADYAYTEVYDRDYSYEDVQKLGNAAKTYLMPYCSELYSSIDFSALEALDDRFAQIPEEEQRAMIKSHLSSLSPALLEAFDYMETYHLYDLAASDVKYNGAFTALLADYNAPFMLGQPSGSFYDFITIIHEYGHYNAFYQTPEIYKGLFASLNLDIAEINSQALVMLFSDVFPNILEADQLAIARQYAFYNTAAGVLQALAINDLEQQVYTTHNMTLDQIEEAAQACFASYGLKITENSWVEIPHLFQSPLYYISYGTSATSSMQLWADSNAMEKYLKLLEHGGDSYQEALAASAIPSPFDESAFRSMTETLWSKTFERENPYFDFTDVSGHWAESSIIGACGAGLFGGVSETAFAPDSGMTRGMFVTALYRMAGGSTEPYPSAFSDVAPDAWYAQPVDWAVSLGIAGGVGGGRFAPDQLVTREQMAVMMHKFYQKIQQTELAPDLTDALAPFTDRASISSWAEEGMAFSVAVGLIGGKGEGLLDPQGTTTRAEVATILMRAA